MHDRDIAWIEDFGASNSGQDMDLCMACNRENRQLNKRTHSIVLVKLASEKNLVRPVVVPRCLRCSLKRAPFPKTNCVPVSAAYPSWDLRPRLTAAVALRLRTPRNVVLKKNGKLLFVAQPRLRHSHSLAWVPISVSFPCRRRKNRSVQHIVLRSSNWLFWKKLGIRPN